MAALDPSLRGDVLAGLRDVITDLAIPTLLVTHDFEEAAALADRIGVLVDGRLLQVGTPSELVASPKDAFVASFTGANVLAGVARRGPGGLTAVELDDRGVVLRVNEAFASMVALPRDSIEDQPWTAIASVVVGADDVFVRLRMGGQSQISRPDGQVLHLESRTSAVPTTPPRTLMLVRDVTAARVADQTIRSLFQFLQDRDEDRSRLMRRTNAAIESERNRIARDLHDGPVQGVSAASLSLEAALLMIRAGDVDQGVEVLTKIREELAGEADALRRLMSGLRPPVLEERGLLPALRETLVRFGADQNVDTEFSGRVDVPLPEDLETLAYRIVQEALSNAAKHAKATQVMVMVQATDSQLRVEIEDDGQGFDAGLARDFLRDGRVGLASMRERVELASGSLVVRSSPGRGTSIAATLPLDELTSSGGGASLHEAS
jgi:signal transduction histidine kinase